MTFARVPISAQQAISRDDSRANATHRFKLNCNESATYAEQTVITSTLDAKNKHVGAINNGSIERKEFLTHTPAITIIILPNLTSPYTKLNLVHRHVINQPSAS